MAISLALHAVALAAALQFLVSGPAAASTPKPALEVGALIECLAPGELDDPADDLADEAAAFDLDRLTPPPDPLLPSAADELATPLEPDLPLEHLELQPTPRLTPAFEVPLDAIRIRVRPQPPSEPTAAPTRTPTPAPTLAPTTPTAAPPVARPTARAAGGAGLRVLSQPDMLDYYPLEARRRGIEGRAIVLIDVDPQGRVTSARVLQSTGSALLDRQAVRYLQAMRFHPGPGGRTKAPVHFRLSS